MTPKKYNLINYDAHAHTVKRIRELLATKSDDGHGHYIDDIKSSDGKALQYIIDNILPILSSQEEATLGVETELRSWNPQRISHAIRTFVLTGLNLDPTTHILTVQETDNLLMALGKLQRQIADHNNNYINPHNTNFEQVGAPSITQFNQHISNRNNPHSVTLAQVLGNTESSGDEETGLVPINFGGTGADNKLAAKTNLGITYGTTLPTSGDEGDIFILIVED